IQNNLPANVMVPKSVLNDLRRQAIATLQESRDASRNRVINPQALDELRCESRSYSTLSVDRTPSLNVLVRSLEQLEAVLAWQPDLPLSRPAIVYCDFEDLRRYHDAVAKARDSGLAIGLATLRVIKPGEEGLLSIIAKAQPDAVLV